MYILHIRVVNLILLSYFVNLLRLFVHTLMIITDTLKQRGRVIEDTSKNVV